MLGLIFFYVWETEKQIWKRASLMPFLCSVIGAIYFPVKCDLNFYFFVVTNFKIFSLERICLQLRSWVLIKWNFWPLLCRMHDLQTWKATLKSNFCAFRPSERNSPNRNRLDFRVNLRSIWICLMREKTKYFDVIQFCKGL